MKDHETEARCPNCNDSMVLTTEWGWIDDETCTATLCCPSCRTLTQFAEDDDIVRCYHHRRTPDQDREAAEAASLAGLAS
jgi:hypothetical protein